MTARRALSVLMLLLAGCVPQVRPATVATPAASAVPQTPPKAMQWLIGSAEGSALSRQAYNVLTDYALAKVADRAAGRPVEGVVMTPAGTLDSPAFVPCGARPLAAMFDIDETVLFNLGWEYDDARAGGLPWDPKRWMRWERDGADKVVAVPGAREAIARLRAAGLTVIFNSNRDRDYAAETAQALQGAGVGPAVPGRTLYLQGDVAPGSAKDPRRLKASESYCIVALGGDQLGDFTDRFTALMKDVPGRRAAAGAAPIARMWGRGWFVLPNPLYGTGTVGGYDEVFPADKRWTDQGAK